MTWSLRSLRLSTRQQRTTLSRTFWLVALCHSDIGVLQRYYRNFTLVPPILAWSTPVCDHLRRRPSPQSCDKSWRQNAVRASRTLQRCVLLMASCSTNTCMDTEPARSIVGPGALFWIGVVDLLCTHRRGGGGRGKTLCFSHLCNVKKLVRGKGGGGVQIWSLKRKLSMDDPNEGDFIECVWQTLARTSMCSCREW